MDTSTVLCQSEHCQWQPLLTSALSLSAITARTHTHCFCLASMHPKNARGPSKGYWPSSRRVIFLPRLSRQNFHYVIIKFMPCPCTSRHPDLDLCMLHSGGHHAGIADRGEQSWPDSCSKKVLNNYTCNLTTDCTVHLEAHALLLFFVLILLC